MTDRFVDLLRHGEVEGGGRFRGSHDDPLADAGWAQMHAWVAAEAAAGRATWDRVLCSPAKRCRVFAHRLGEQRDLAVHEVPAFRERGFGAWEGRRAEEIPIEDLSRFWADPVGYDPPASEPFALFRQRVLAGWREILAGDARHSLIITHGGVVRVILGDILSLAAQALLLIEVPPACHTRLRIPGGDWRPSLMRHGASDG
jgi:alpha-ribazole phosphatase